MTDNPFYLTRIHFQDGGWINTEATDTTIDEAVRTVMDHHGEEWCKGIQVLHIFMDRAPIDVTADVLERINPSDADEDESTDWDFQRAEYRAGVGGV